MSAFLDKRETSGISDKRLEANKKRLSRQAFLRRDNLRLADELDRELACRGEENHPRVAKLVQNLRGCSSHGLFRQFLDNGALGYIGAHTCKNKLCQICNSDRKRRIRAKYFKYFESNPQLRTDYDFMHLTLTVPHGKEGWKGQRVYVQEIGQAFNVMRKAQWWKDLVHAGELNVEFTKRDNGLHIHIHALLLVEKVKGSRNKLYTSILERWNALTVDPASRRRKWTETQIGGLRRSLRHLSDSEFQAMADSLDPRGSTLVGLESLYVLSESKRPGFHWCDRSSRYKRYINPKNEDDFMAGMMECLKYHFEPMSFKDENDGWNTDLIFDLAPLIYRKPLYRKFGAFYGVKELNLNKQSAEEEILEILEEEGSEVVVNPESGEICERAEYQYVMADLGRAFVDAQGRMQIRGPAATVPVDSVVQAYKVLIQPDLLFHLKRLNL